MPAFYVSSLVFIFWFQYVSASRSCFWLVLYFYFRYSSYFIYLFPYAIFYIINISSRTETFLVRVFVPIPFVFFIIAFLVIIPIQHVLLGIYVFICLVYLHWVCHKFLSKPLIHIKFLPWLILILSCAWIILLCVLVLDISIYRFFLVLFILGRSVVCLFSYYLRFKEG